MRAGGDVHKALEEAFRGAWFFTGSGETAEYAVLDGIAAMDFGPVADDLLIVETVKSAMRRRADPASQSEETPSHLPWELQRLFLLAPVSRDCIVFRVLLGITVGSCSRMLRLEIEEFEQLLWAALQELPRLEARRPTCYADTPTPGSFATCPTRADKSNDTEGD
jgi:hypothetical protein